VVQRFLLNRIDTKSSASSVGGQDDFTATIFPNEAKALISVAQSAFPRAELAYDAIVFRLPPAADC
jgi:hypothetical protein